MEAEESNPTAKRQSTAQPENSVITACKTPDAIYIHLERSGECKQTTEKQNAATEPPPPVREDWGEAANPPRSGKARHNQKIASSLPAKLRTSFTYTSSASLYVKTQNPNPNPCHGPRDRNARNPQPPQTARRPCWPPERRQIHPLQRPHPQPRLARLRHPRPHPRPQLRRSQTGRFVRPPFQRQTCRARKNRDS